LGIKGTAQKNWGSRERELKTFLGARGFINGEQGIKSKKIKGSWEHVSPPGRGSLEKAVYNVVVATRTHSPTVIYISIVGR